MHINLVSKLYASNFYAYWAFQQAQSAHQPQAGYQLSSHEKLQAEQLTNPPGLHEDENQAAKKAKTANAGMEKFVEVTLQEAVKCMQGEMVKQNGEMLKLLMQHRSNPKPDLAVPADVGTFAEYKTLGGSYAVVSPTSSSSSSSSSREGSRDEGLGKKKNGSSRDENQQMVERAQSCIGANIVQGASSKAIPKPPSAISKRPADYKIRKERLEAARAEADRLGIPFESSGSSDMTENSWPPSPTRAWDTWTSPSPPPSPPPPSNGCAAEKVAPKKKKRKEKQGRDAHNPHSKPPDITITVDGKHIDSRGTSSQPAPTEGHQETPKDPRRQRKKKEEPTRRQRRNSKVKLEEPA